MAVEMTYVVTGNVVIDGEKVPEGTVIPDAGEWKYIDAIISQGKIAKVPVESLDESTEKRETPIPRGFRRAETQEVGPTEGYDEPPLSQEEYNELSIGDVEGLVESRTLTIEQVDEFESNRERYREGIKNMVLDVEDADVEPSKDEDDEEQDGEG